MFGAAGPGLARLGDFRLGFSEELDSLDVAVSLDEDAQLPGGTGGTSGSTGGTTGGSAAGSTGGGTVGGSVGGTGALASTGSGIPTAALAGASAVAAAAGAAVVLAVRRRESAQS